MFEFDITETNRAVRELLEVTENPRHRFLLQAYDRHRNLEMAGRYEEIFEPEMTVEHPVYHFNILGRKITLDGAEAVQAVYRDWSLTNQSVFYTDDERLAVSDHMIVSTSTMYQQVLGSVLAAEGAPVNPDAMYLVKSAEHMIWPYDDHGRLVGEEVAVVERPVAGGGQQAVELGRLQLHHLREGQHRLARRLALAGLQSADIAVVEAGLVGEAALR